MPNPLRAIRRRRQERATARTLERIYAEDAERRDAHAALLSSAWDKYVQHALDIANSRETTRENGVPCD